jgi:hypothetical protein
MNVAAQRTTAQRIARPLAGKPADLVRWMGAVQAQDYGASKWAVGLRLAGAAVSDTSVARAIDDGSVVRTHALRGTWQLVAAEDVRWMIAVVAPTVIAKAERRHRQLGLDERTFDASRKLLARALRGVHLTRAEIGEVLERGGISVEGQRLPHLLGRAELDGVICGGPRRGKQDTWALLDERVPPSPSSALARDEALAELARRHLQSRAPATLADFTWWSGLRAADARAGYEAAARTIRPPRASAPAHDAHLLPAFDEYLVGYQDRDAQLDPAHAERLNAGGGMLGPCVLVGGKVVGTWSRTLARASVSIEVATFARIGAQAKHAIEEAAHRYAAFVGYFVTAIDFRNSLRL